MVDFYETKTVFLLLYDGYVSYTKQPMGANFYIWNATGYKGTLEAEAKMMYVVSLIVDWFEAEAVLNQVNGKVVAVDHS